MLNSHYNTPGFKKESISIIIKLFEEFCTKVDFDTIVCRGVSGALISPILAFNCNKELLIVRKETSHSYFDVEGFYGKKLVIVDDFIKTGETCDIIREKVNNAYIRQSGCFPPYFEGIFLWKSLGCYEKPYHLIVPVYYNDDGILKQQT